ncbi:MAG: aminotransferase class IV [Thermodesulfobacteriota bacterium]
MDELILIDGSAVKEPLTRSLFYGEGLFETFRWKGEFPRYISEHLSRLKNGSALLRIPFPDESYILEKIEEAVKSSVSNDLYVKVALISKGDRIFFKNPDESALLVMTRKYMETEESVSVCVATQRRNQDSLLLKYKTFNYLENIIGRREAMEKGYDDAIFLNTSNELTEATSSNIFWARGKDLFTPVEDSGLLPGIARQVILDISGDLGFKINSRKFDLSYLLNSDFAFLTNSLRGTAYISKVNKQLMPSKPESYKKIKNVLFEKLDWLNN